jgi:hypothetical protein
MVGDSDANIDVLEGIIWSVTIGDDGCILAGVEDGPWVLVGGVNVGDTTVGFKKST